MGLPRNASRADGVELRFYESRDSDQLRKFSCAHHGRDWQRSAEKIIRESPDELGIRPSLRALVAEHMEAGIVGAAIYGLGSQGATIGMPVIFSLGVAISWQRQRIGTDLKVAALEDIALSGLGSDPWVLSEVHRRNFQMEGLNKNLGVVWVPNPEDREYNFHGIIPKVAGEPRLDTDG